MTKAERKARNKMMRELSERLWDLFFLGWVNDNELETTRSLESFKVLMVKVQLRKMNHRSLTGPERNRWTSQFERPLDDNEIATADRLTRSINREVGLCSSFVKTR
jgi:hypothetical protein